MITCPLSNEFDQLVEFARSQGLGDNAEFEAYRAYMIINQDLPIGDEPVIPSNDEFLAIMDSLNVFTFDGPGRVQLTAKEPGSKDYYEDVENAYPHYKIVKNPIPFDNSTVDNDRARSIVNILAERLSNNTGVPVEYITAEEALELTKDVNQWSGQPAFYYGDTVYIIPDLATTKSVLHEFAHPIIRSIYLNNKPLFDKLVSDLLKTETGKQILARAKEAYPTADENDPVILEEALVMALTESAVTREDSAFNKFISNLLYAIKQLLRKLFGKVKVESLDANTTLEELSDMLVMESFALDTKPLSRKDIATYMTEVNDYIEAFEKVKDTSIQNAINTLYDNISTHIAVVKNNKDYEQMKKILGNYYNTNDLEQIRKILAPFQDIKVFMTNELSKLQDDADFAKKRINGFVESLNTLDHILEKVKKNINKLTADPNQKDNVAKVVYINNILRSWKEMLLDIENIIREEELQGNINENNPFSTLIGNIERKITDAQKLSSEIYREGSSQAIKKTLSPMKEKIDEKYQTTLAYLRNKGASPERIAQHQQDYYGLRGKRLQDFLNLNARIESGELLNPTEKRYYEDLKLESYRDGAYLTDEKIDYLMTGRLGDASALNSFLESYMNNTDPIVFGLATYVKNNITDAFTRAQSLGNSFLTDVKPILQRAGYNQSNPADFFRKLTFTDKRGTLDENGKFTTEEVISFINPWKDYRGEMMMMKRNLNDAKEAALASGNTEEVFRLQKELDSFREKYFHRDYTDAYYDREKIFRKGDNDVIGAKAERLRKELLAEIQRLTNSIQRSQQYANNDIEQNETELEVLWERYRELHSDYNKVGKLKTQEEREIAARLREYRDASKDIFEMTLLPGFFEGALNNYEQYLIDRGYNKMIVDPNNPTGPKIPNPVFNKLRSQWIQKNTRVKIKDSWYKKQEELWDEINSIIAKVPKDQQEQINLAKYQKQLQDLLNKKKDEDNQPEGTAMTEDLIAKIKSTEKIIEDIKKNLEGSNGLTPIENEFLSQYFEVVNAGERPSTDDYNRAQELLAKRSANRLSKEDKARLNTLYAQLEEIKVSTPTQYYLDVINNVLHNQIGKLKSIYGFTTITAANADVVLTEEFYTQIVESDPDVKEWFDKNHTFSEKRQDGELVTQIKRVKAWSVNRPRDEFYYEKFSFINSEGQKEVLLGMPTMKFYERNVKAEYVTEQVTIAEALERGNIELANWDEKAGDWLPRLDIDDNRFKNEKYFELKKDKALFDALKVMLKWHFKFQEGNPTSSKLGFDIPRYRKPSGESRLEYITADEKLENPISRFFRRVKSMFVASPDDYDQGYNLDDQVMLMEGELYNDENAGIPITGLSKLKPDDVSLDLTFSMLKYMISGQKQQKLIEMNPMVRALQMTLKDPKNAIKGLKDISRKTHKNRSFLGYAAEKLTLGKDEARSTRIKAIDNFIEREFEGKTNKGLLGEETVIISKIADNLTRWSAFGYFALDIPSAIKNNFSARIQSMQEAVGGRYYNASEYAKGTVWGNQVTAEISLQLYKFGPKSHNIQLTELFDVAPDRFEEKFADHGSRSLTMDAIKDLSWMTSFRKLGEMNTAYSVFAAMMYHEKNVTRTINGVTTNISYMDAWETIDGQIRLKEGVDPAWGPEGDKFKAFKNKVQGVNNNLNGAYAKFDYAEADRYLAWRWLTFLKRYFTRMFLNRYAGLNYNHKREKGKRLLVKYRYDAALQDTVMGFHVEAVRALFRGVKSRGEYLQTLSPSEKVALLKLTTDFIYGFMFMLITSWIFGYDEEDEDRYKKIRERSGPLPFFGVAEGEEPFKLGGWLMNHGLLMTFQLRNETMQWMPITGVGFDSYADVIKFDAIATKNTFDNYKKMGSAAALHIGNTLFGTDDSKAYWDQREGPYSWLQEDGYKFWSYFTRSMGLTGRTLDPGDATIDWVKSQNWR